MKAPSGSRENLHYVEISVHVIKKEYQKPFLVELGSLARLSQTDILLSVGGGED